MRRASCRFRLCIVFLTALFLVSVFAVVVKRGQFFSLAIGSSIIDNKEKDCLERVASGGLHFQVPKVEPEDICLFYDKARASASLWKGNIPVPKIIHQSWKQTELPRDFKVWSESWKRVHPDWEYWFWTDGDNRELVETYYPEYLSMYDSLWVEINRADFVRALYMHRYGGVYADLDTWCLRPMEHLVHEPKAYVAEMSEETGFNQNIPNAWLASSPGHPFWIFFAEVVTKYVHLLQRDNQYVQAEQIAGPMILKQSLDAWNDIYKSDPTVGIIKAGKVYVDDWHEFHGPQTRSTFYSQCPRERIHQKQAEQRCRKAYPDAYALTFWTHSWGR
jgi:hypothetical protein